MTTTTISGIREPRDGVSLVLQGARDMTPMVIGIIPFGLAVGATIASSSVEVGVGLASAPIILAGAAQLTTVEMLDAGANPIVIIASALLINLRILLYSTSLAPWFAGAPLRQRLLLAIPVIDQTHLVAMPRFERGDLDLGGRIAYYSGGGGWLIAAWLGSQSFALLVGAGLPPAARLDMAAPLVLVGLIAKSVATRPAVVTAAVAAIVAGVGAGLPFNAATLVAIVVAIAAGVMTERRSAPEAELVERTS